MAKEQAKKKLKGRWNLYDVSGNKITRKNKSCPKCGAGFFLANNKNRTYCGNCHYTEFTSKVKKE